jgi:hypothetical protein
MGKLLTRFARTRQVCRKGLPATCSGTLIAPNLVLSARHCLDTPAALNGTLDRVVFASDMLSKSAVSRSVEKVVSTRDYGISAEGGGDLILIRFAGTAPPAWRVQELPLGLLPSKAEEAEARRRNSPLYPDGLGMPTLLTYGYGQQSTQGTVDPDKYSAGVLKKIAVRSHPRPHPVPNHQLHRHTQTNTLPVPSLVFLALLPAATCTSG